MLAKIHITLKKDVLDPQGKVIANSLSDLGFEGIQSVRQGKYIEIILDGDNKEAATNKLNQMCEKLLANLVIEDYSLEID
ncbi:phosphoribosylformylglycinamidine synthase subunit PurS [Pelagibacterales bacterium]|nr:phosphoribosylformylglycinamidine synthase subunit PurS [Pelagibacterales bacterium]|tara:strand:+ start:527 stop:766 length:240 start_codon:yes stop_codon:yes gene_type:complete